MGVVSDVGKSDMIPEQPAEAQHIHLNNVIEADIQSHKDNDNLDKTNENSNKLAVNISHHETTVDSNSDESNMNGSCIGGTGGESGCSISSTGKKKKKRIKKEIKLDAKTKLEKSRQSARECRARKKLRYQYLEDLVNNRERAVVKLREELNLFGSLSKQIDSGTLSVADRNMILSDTNTDAAVHKDTQKS